jgi:hypothetical protein
VDPNFAVALLQHLNLHEQLLVRWVDERCPVLLLGRLRRNLDQPGAGLVDPNFAVALLQYLNLHELLL